MVFSGWTNAIWSNKSLDSVLQNAYIQAKAWASLKNLPTTIQDWNLYDQAYAIAQDQSTTAIWDAIGHATKTLNSLVFSDESVAVKCDLQTSDTIAILYQVPRVATELRQEIAESSRKNNPSFYEDFWNSCSKLYACYNDEKVTNARQTQYCKDIAVDAYNMWKIHSDIQNSLMNANYWSNIYVDNDKTNGSFDLLVDIERIANVLFESNKQPSEILFFKLPTVSATQPWTVWAFGPNSNPLGFGANTFISWWATTNNSNNGSVNPNDQNSWSSWATTQNNAQNNSDIQPINDFINQNNETNPIPKNQNWWLITNNICYIPNLDDPIEPDEFTLTTEQVDEILSNIFVNYNNLLTDYQNPAPIWSFFPSNGGSWISNSIDAQRAIEDAQRKRSCTNTCADNVNTQSPQWEQDLNQWLCETNCCFDACQWLAGTDYIICTTDCLCGEYASPNNMFRIKYCKIPVQWVSPQPRTVMSVEEIIDELDKLIKKLKEQWMPMKLAKPEEFMDSTNENLNFANLFVFDVFVKLKPMFESKPPHIVEQEKEEELKSNNRNVLGFWDLENKNERNKYVMIDDSSFTEGSKNVKWALSDLKNNVEEAEKDGEAAVAEQIYIFAQRQAQLELQANWEANAVIADEIDIFLRQNDKFWQEVIDTLDGIWLSSKRLLEKVENEEE